MNELDRYELEKVAEAYEELLAPVLFSEWPHRLADAAGIGRGQYALDVACGTGRLTRVLAERVGPEGSVSGVDANPGMLAVASRIAPEVDWREGDAESLPCKADEFDAAFCQFGLMLFSSPETAVREMQRVVKPGGTLVAAVFGSLEDLPAYAAMADVYGHVVNSSVADALRMPFSMGDTDALASVFDSVGIHSIAVKTETGTAHFSSVKHMVLSDVLGWFPFAGIQLDEDTIGVVTEEAGIALKTFQTLGGAVEFQVPVHIAVAGVS